MAKRGGVILDLCWVHATATYPRSDDLITFCQQQVAADIPGASLSVNMKVDQSQALIKVTALAEEFQSLPGAVRNAIIRIYRGRSPRGCSYGQQCSLDRFPR